MRRVTVLLLVLSVALTGCTVPPTREATGPSAVGQARQSSGGPDGSQEDEASASPAESGAATDTEQAEDVLPSAPPGEESDSLPPAAPGGPDEEVAPPPEERDAGGPGAQSWEAGEAQFLEAVGTAWRGDVPDEAIILQIGRRACDQIGAGTEVADVNVVEGNGEERDRNNDVSRLAALHLLCPELVRF